MVFPKFFQKKRTRGSRKYQKSIRKVSQINEKPLPERQL